MINQSIIIFYSDHGLNYINLTKMKYIVVSKNNNLFINACETNNLLHKYLIKKFVDIDIHEYSEYPFQIELYKWAFKYCTMVNRFK